MIEKLIGIEIDGMTYYYLEELETKGWASKSTVYRRKREGRVTIYHDLKGKPMLLREDLGKFVKRNSAA